MWCIPIITVLTSFWLFTPNFMLEDSLSIRDVFNAFFTIWKTEMYARGKIKLYDNICVQPITDKKCRLVPLYTVLWDLSMDLSNILPALWVLSDINRFQSVRETCPCSFPPVLSTHKIPAVINVQTTVLLPLQLSFNTRFCPVASKRICQQAVIKCRSSGWWCAASVSSWVWPCFCSLPVPVSCLQCQCVFQKWLCSGDRDQAEIQTPLLPYCSHGSRK